jgi:hypothetical protein
MTNDHISKNLRAPVALGIVLTLIAGSTFANPPKGRCHNIGGPRDLGANCDGTGTCTYELDGGTIDVAPGNFLGIVIGGEKGLPTKALAAHIAHGDGRILAIFDPLCTWLRR